MLTYALEISLKLRDYVFRNIFIQKMPNNVYLKLIDQPILKKMVRMTTKPKRILFTFFRLWSVFKYFGWTHPIKPIEHLDPHNLCTMDVEDGLWEICNLQMLDESIEEWILWAAINSIDPLLWVDVEEAIFIIFG